MVHEVKGYKEWVAACQTAGCDFCEICDIGTEPGQNHSLEVIRYEVAIKDGYVVGILNQNDDANILDLEHKNLWVTGSQALAALQATY